MEEFLPLPHHPEEPVVQDRDLDRDVVRGYGREFLDIHLETPVPGNIEDGLVRAGEVGTDGGREPVSHRAEPPGGDPGPGFPETEVLGGPHLVLADLADDDALPVQER